MPHIAYDSERLFYNSDTVDRGEQSKYIIQNISDTTFESLKNLPSKSFKIGTNVQDLVEGIIRQETIGKAA